MKEREFVSSRRKAALFLLGSLVFVAIAVFLPGDSAEPERWRIWSGGFFGLCAAVFAWTFLRPPRLRLNTRGYTLSGGFLLSPKTVPWHEVEDFFIYRPAKGGEQIGLNFKPGARKRTLLMELNRRMGADGGLPGLWAVSPGELVAELNEYRLRADAPTNQGSPA
jgi:hypothetical protein